MLSSSLGFWDGSLSASAPTGSSDTTISTASSSASSFFIFMFVSSC